VERALRLAPTLPEVQIRAAHYQVLSGNWEKAIEHFERARAIDPDNPLVLGAMSAAYLYGNRLDEAIAVTRRIVLHDPLSAASHRGLADKLLFANRLEEAMEEYRQVLPLRQVLAIGAARVDAAVRGIGDILLLQRRATEALEWIEGWPSGPDRDRGLTMAYHALGRAPEADAARQRLIASAGASGSLEIAEVDAYRGDFDEALVWLQRVGGLEDCRGSSQNIFPVFYSPFLARMRGDPRWEAWRTETARTMQDCDFMR
jgi:tetratricopeptide (TPR) repeat protein